MEVLIYKLTVKTEWIAENSNARIMSYVRRERDEYSFIEDYLDGNTMIIHFKTIKSAVESMKTFAEVSIEEYIQRNPHLTSIDINIHYKQVCRSLHYKNKFVKSIKVDKKAVGIYNYILTYSIELTKEILLSKPITKKDFIEHKKTPSQ